MITSALTIDVEDWFQVSNLEPYVPRDRWTDFPLTVERNVDTILALLSERQISATFFILGWIANRVPGLIRKIAQEGHEIASHGWDHRRVSSLSPAAFADDVKRSRDALEQISGRSVLGYRAPSFSSMLIANGRIQSLQNRAINIRPVSRPSSTTIMAGQVRRDLPGVR